MELTTEEIVEGNKSIAEFMGLIREESDSSYNKAQYYKPVKGVLKGDRFICYFDGLQYHSDWSWLMPALEKIELMGYRSEIFKADDSHAHLCNIYTWHAEKSEFICCGKDWSNTKIEAVYAAVLSFINWYKNK